MTEINFYHLMRKTLEQVLPEMLSKTLERGLKAVVKVSDKTQSEELSKFLWVYSQDSFLPHGTSEDKYPEENPVLITDKDENLNNAEYLFLTNMTWSGKLNEYEKVLNIFDGNNNESLNNAREKWKELQTEGKHQLTYWKQTETGWSRE